MRRLLSARGLERAASAIAGHVKARPGKRWLLAHEDAMTFTAGMFGLMTAGKTVVIPPNFLPDAIAAVSPHFDEALLPGDLEGLLSAVSLPENGVPLDTLMRNGDAEIVLFTSGSTGVPREAKKRFIQLTSETAVLERCFGAAVGKATVVPTVPHHHIYGLLFRVLWPLTAGRPCLSNTCLLPAELFAALDRHPRSALVSSPAFLSRLLRACDVSRYRGRVTAVFSSGGPLGEEDALRLAEALGAAPFEILGSTETGGIAFRRRTAKGQDVWTPLPEVAADQAPSGALRAVSPFTGGEPVETGDAAAFFPSGGFRLLGRLDRVVKLQEKRVSLDEVEAVLRNHPWVAQAAVVLLQGPRDELGAVVVLEKSAPGPGGEGLGLFRETLRSHLAKRFEAVALPRRWRFVPEIPVDDRGKTTVEALQGLFSRNGAAAPAAERP